MGVAGIEISYPTLYPIVLQQAYSTGN